MRTTSGFVAGLALSALATSLASGTYDNPAHARKDEPAASGSLENPELARLHEEDQADRRPKNGGAIDPAVIVPRDTRREGRVKELYETGRLQSGKDFYRAAMILQHAGRAEDTLLAHELCLVALSKGEPQARWLAAATEDRFLMRIGRPQRFGTQYRSSKEGGPVRLHEVGPGVTDGLRRELGVPTLREARRREAVMDRLFKLTTP